MFKSGISFDLKQITTCVKGNLNPLKMLIMPVDESFLCDKNCQSYSFSKFQSKLWGFMRYFCSGPIKMPKFLK